MRLLDGDSRPGRRGAGNGRSRRPAHLLQPSPSRASTGIVNSLGVMAAVRAAGGDLASAGLALAEMGRAEGVAVRVTLRIAVAGGEALLIDESYNANPASMRATLKALARHDCRSRRIAVLGSMKELGDFSDAFHRQRLTEPLTEAGVTHAILVGTGDGSACRGTGESLRQSAWQGRSPSRIAGHLPKPSRCSGNSVLLRGDAVLVKGSNSVGLGRLVSHFYRKRSCRSGRLRPERGTTECSICLPNGWASRAPSIWCATRPFVRARR